MNSKAYFDKLQELSQKYQSTLEDNLGNNEREQEKITSEIETIQTFMKQLEQISEQPEWTDSFIPINSIAYIPATIFHTSEYYVKLGMENYTFMSLKEVLKYLERKINNSEQILHGYKEQHRQLEERFNAVSTSSFETTTETKDMPNEIVSEMGTAYKTTSGFYEIIESYDEDKEEEFYKKRKENKLCKKIDKDCSDKLDTSKKEENIFPNYDFMLENRVKEIIEDSNVYQQLLDDATVSNYCESLEVRPEQTEALLNDLIVKALLMDPAVYKPND